LDQVGVARHRRHLVLPEIEIAARERVEIRGLGVACPRLRRVGHGGTIVKAGARRHRRRDGRLAAAQQGCNALHNGAGNLIC